MRLSALIVISLIITLGCKDNSSNSKSSSNGLAVKAINTGTDDLEISQDAEASIDFCYESEGCIELSGQSFSWVYEGEESLIDYSDDEGKAVGIKVDFHVDNGSGYFEIVEGEAYRDDAGFLEFEEGKTLYTSDEFTEGNTVSYDYGETD